MSYAPGHIQPLVDAILSVDRQGLLSPAQAARLAGRILQEGFQTDDRHSHASAAIAADLQDASLTLPSHLVEGMAEAADLAMDSLPFVPGMVATPELPDQPDYFDGTVWGNVGEDEDDAAGVMIYNWRSPLEGRVHSARALEWLRERHGRITATFVTSTLPDGTPTPARTFWEHMVARGLVDRIIDTQDNDITPVCGIAASVSRP